jgi:hypothetical protein
MKPAIFHCQENAYGLSQTVRSVTGEIKQATVATTGCLVWSGIGDPHVKQEDIDPPIVIYCSSESVQTP